MTWPITAAWQEQAEPIVKWDEIPENFVSGGDDQTGSHPALTRVLRISRKPSVMGGLYVIGGTRVPAYWLYDMFLSLGSVKAVQQQYPHLATDDIFAAISFAMLNPEIMDEDRANHQEALEPTAE